MTGGTFGVFGTIATGPTSPYADRGETGRHCYQYRYLVVGYVGNQSTYTSTSVVRHP